jgi:hypothetical protein
MEIAWGNEKSIQIAGRKRVYIYIYFLQITAEFLSVAVTRGWLHIATLDKFFQKIYGTKRYFYNTYITSSTPSKAKCWASPIRGPKHSLRGGIRYGTLVEEVGFLK